MFTLLNRRSTEVFALFWLAAIPATVAAGQDAGAHFDPLLGHVQFVGHGVVCWTKLNPIPGMERAAVRTADVQYFVQNLGTDAPPSLIHRGRGRVERPAHNLAALTDGAMVVGSNGGFGPSLSWARPGEDLQWQEIKDEDGHSYAYGAVYPDGLLARTSRFESKKADPLIWIPIRNGEVQLILKKTVEQELPDGVSFLRHGDQILWVQAQEQAQPAGRIPTLHILDVSTLSVRQVRADAPLGIPSAFDGRYAFGGDLIADTTTGHCTKTEWMEAFGMIKGVVFGLKQSPEAWEIASFNVQTPDKRRVIYRLEKSKVTSEPGGSLRIQPADLFFVSDDRLWAWDGKTWIDITERAGVPK